MLCFYITLLNFFINFECCFGLSGNLSSSMSICGDVSDTLVSLSLLMACGDPGIMEIILKGLQYECDTQNTCEIK